MSYIRPPNGVVPKLVSDVNLKRVRVETDEGDAIRVIGTGCGDKVTIVPTLTEGTKIADYTINNVDGELYAPTAPTPPVTEVSITPSVATGTKIADFSINGSSGALYAPNDSITPESLNGEKIADYSIGGVSGSLHAPYMDVSLSGVFNDPMNDYKIAEFTSTLGQQTGFSEIYVPKTTFSNIYSSPSDSLVIGTLEANGGDTTYVRMPKLAIIDSSTTKSTGYELAQIEFRGYTYSIKQHALDGVKCYSEEPTTAEELSSTTPSIDINNIIDPSLSMITVIPNNYFFVFQWENEIFVKRVYKNDVSTGIHLDVWQQAYSTYPDTLVHKHLRLEWVPQTRTITLLGYWQYDQDMNNNGAISNWTSTLSAASPCKLLAILASD